MAGTAFVAGRYRLVRRIGSGSMGEVWLAHDERLDRDIAVKLLDLSATPDPTVVERFRREAVATAQLNHPNIVSVFDAGTDGSRAFLVMTLLPGRTIAEIVRTEGPLPLDRALTLVVQVTSALREAHRHGLVHRDVKPANVMVDGTRATVLDFGIAQLSGLDASLTATHAVIGSAAYMSPEHATGLRAGPASDLYGVGCLLMTMLTGQPPFAGENAVAVASQQVSAQPPALSERIRVPRALDQLVDRLLAKDPSQRPDADATLLALRDVEAHQSVDLVGPSPRLSAAATVALPAAPPPRATAVLPVATPPRPAATALLPATGGPQVPTGPTYPPPAPAHLVQPATPRRRRSVAPLVWLVVLALLGGCSYLLGTQAGAITALAQTPQPVTSPTAANTTTRPTAAPTTSRPASSPARPSASSTSASAGPSLALQAAVQAMAGVLSTLPEGQAKDELTDAWDTTGDAVLDRDHPDAQLDQFSSRVQREVRDGHLSVERGLAVLAAVAAVRAAL